MSLDKKLPQAYAPLRLKHSQLEPFFSSIRDRKVTRGYESDAVKVVSDKEFDNSTAFGSGLKNKTNKTKRSPKKRKASSLSSRSRSSSSSGTGKKERKRSSKRKSKLSIEKRLKNANLQ